MVTQICAHMHRYLQFCLPSEPCAHVSPACAQAMPLCEEAEITAFLSRCKSLFLHLFRGPSDLDKSVTLNLQEIMVLSA